MLAVTPCSDRIPVSIRPAESATCGACVGLEERLDGAVGDAERAPGVGRELVAHPLERAAQPHQRVGHRARPAAVEQQRAELAVEVVVDAARQPADRAEHHLEAGAAGRAGPGAEVLGEGVRGEHQAQQVLGALGVAAEPVHVLEHARQRAGRGAHARGGQHVGEALVGVVGSSLSTQTSLLATARPSSTTFASPPTSGRYTEP